MTTNPEPGTALRLEDAAMIIDALDARSKMFPHEPLDVSMKVVLFNIGDRFAKVTCVNGEWTGMKADFPLYMFAIPKCPNGHVCTQDKDLRLGWIEG